MRKIQIFLTLTILALGVSQAFPPASQIVDAAEPVAAWIKPYNSGPPQDGRFFDPGYVVSENRQHLGVDLSALPLKAVVSPVDGEVVTNATSNPDIMQAYLVIRESGTNFEHVLGHISSSLVSGDVVFRGKRVGTIRDWGLRSHVHWGVNRKSVAGAMGYTKEGEWGWGRAPAAVSLDQARNRGWIDPLNPRIAEAVSPSRSQSTTTRTTQTGPGATSASIPSTPRNASPGRSSEPGSQLSGSSVTIRWATVRGAVEYDLSVRDLTDKRSFPIDRVSRTYHIVRVKPGHTYRWSVQACNAAGCSDASERLYFNMQ